MRVSVSLCACRGMSAARGLRLLCTIALRMNRNIRYESDDRNAREQLGVGFEVKHVVGQLRVGLIAQKYEGS